MILNVSSKCDIPAFFSEWFMNRIKDGYVDVRNKIHKKQIDRILLNKENIDCIIFHTKNPIPILRYLDQLREYKLLFYITITPYSRLVESKIYSTYSMRKILISILQISSMIGKNNVIVKYDPIFLNDTYTKEFHIKAFTSICRILKDYIKTIVIDFIKLDYRTEANISKLNLKEVTHDDKQFIISSFLDIAKSNNIKLKMCSCYDIGEFPCQSCLDESTIKSIVGNNRYIKYKTSKIKPNYKYIKTVDIGFNNCCSNYGNMKIGNCINHHDKNSSILLGNEKSDDIVKIV